MDGDSTRVVRATVSAARGWGVPAGVEGGAADWLQIAFRLVATLGGFLIFAALAGMATARYVV